MRSRGGDYLSNTHLGLHGDKTDDVDFLPVVKICLLVDDSYRLIWASNIFNIPFLPT
jgi:hypothetical protein